MRKHYLDNIRWATVLLVMVYHVFYMFNAAGVLGGVGSFEKVQYQDGFLYFVYPWFMLLLFVVAGMSARYSLEKLPGKEFLRRRTGKLLVPSTLGLFAFQWIVGYFNIKIGGGLAYMPGFLVYPVSAVSGTGPLWFVQTLWLFSLVLLLVRRIDKDRLYRLGEKCNSVVLLLFALLIWAGAQILNLPVLTMYRFGIYLAGFLLGYFVISHESVQERIENMHLPMLVIAVIMGIVYSICYFGADYSSAPVLRSLFTNIYAWVMVLAILGCGRAWFDKTGGFARYMTKNSYGLYVLHYVLVLLPCYYLKYFTALPPWLIYLLAIAIVLVATPLLNVVISSIPVIRFLVLGIRRKNVKGQSNPIKEDQ
ncbi:MAG: acyltransferase [Muribaculaceae bacterium]|nr:acyltransferase [Roseburia sp.]MCM1430992.1 acyltransferase [Muribaculaceae bacterium]MCM1493774.1 acyltransferase [Muribaculaceae bacterium]